MDGARAVQAARFGPGGPACNDQMGPAELSRFCALDDACRAVMKGAFDRMGLTARSYDRILRVARTIADLDGAEAVAVEHLAEALQYRPQIACGARLDARWRQARPSGQQKANWI